MQGAVDFLSMNLLSRYNATHILPSAIRVQNTQTFDCDNRNSICLITARESQ